MDIIGIAAVTLDGFIARHSLERVAWTKDLSLFKHQTKGHAVVMGFNTKKTLKRNVCTKIYDTVSFWSRIFTTT